MLLLTVTEFRNNISKYLQMALTEHIALKTKGGIIELTPSTEIRVNPSPSNDPYWNVPDNLDRLNKDVAELENTNVSELKSWDELKLELEGLVSKN